MLETLRNALKVKEIRKRLLYTFMMLVVVRLGSQIPLPFVNGDTVKSITSQFSEGAFSFFAAINGKYVYFRIEYYTLHYSFHHHPVINNCNS